MSVRRTILIEPYRSPFSLKHESSRRKWCAREYVQHDDESRTTRVLHTAPTRREVADWLEAQRTARAHVEELARRANEWSTAIHPKGDEGVGYPDPD